MTYTRLKTNSSKIIFLIHAQKTASDDTVDTDDLKHNSRKNIQKQDI